MLPNGYLKFTVSNVAELELLMMHNKQYAAEIAHNVSGRKRQEIIERAVSLLLATTGVGGARGRSRRPRGAWWLTRECGQQ